MFWNTAWKGFSYLRRPYFFFLFKLRPTLNYHGATKALLNKSWDMHTEIDSSLRRIRKFGPCSVNRNKRYHVSASVITVFLGTYITINIRSCPDYILSICYYNYIYLLQLLHLLHALIAIYTNTTPISVMQIRQLHVSILSVTVSVFHWFIIIFYRKVNGNQIDILSPGRGGRTNVLATHTRRVGQ